MAKSVSSSVSNRSGRPGDVFAKPAAESLIQTPKPGTYYSQKAKPAISSVEVVKRYSDEETSEYVTKIRLWDKTRALQMLGKHLGILRDIVEHTGKDGGPIKVQETVTIDPDSLSPEAREILWKEVQKARAAGQLPEGGSE